MNARLPTPVNQSASPHSPIDTQEVLAEDAAHLLMRIPASHQAGGDIGHVGEAADARWVFPGGGG